jgi:hypothetical protein
VVKNLDGNSIYLTWRLRLVRYALISYLKSFISELLHKYTIKTKYLTLVAKRLRRHGIHSWQRTTAVHNKT